MPGLMISSKQLEKMEKNLDDIRKLLQPLEDSPDNFSHDFWEYLHNDKEEFESLYRRVQSLKETMVRSPSTSLEEKCFPICARFRAARRSKKSGREIESLVTRCRALRSTLLNLAAMRALNVKMQEVRGQGADSEESKMLPKFRIADDAASVAINTDDSTTNGVKPREGFSNEQGGNAAAVGTTIGRRRTVGGSRISKKRYDVFLSVHSIESLSFQHELAKTVDSFVQNFVLEKINEKWQNGGGHGKLSLFHTGDVSEQWSELMEALLQTRGGGVVVCIITKNYLAEERCCVPVLRGAAKLFNAENSEKVRLLIICLDCDVNAVLKNEIMSELGLWEVKLRSMPTGRGDGPVKVGSELAQSIVKLLIETCCVAGSSIRESFANLLEIIDAKGPRTDILANQLWVEGKDLTRMQVLRDAVAAETISQRNVDRLVEILEDNTGLEYLKSYVRKWNAKWTEGIWDARNTEPQQQST